MEVKRNDLKTIPNMKTGIELIAEERTRQIEKEGWDENHDNAHNEQELAIAASVYAAPESIRDYGNEHECEVPYFWPWDNEWWKPTPDNRIRELVKAGALIAAEIDRLNRLIR